MLKDIVLGALRFVSLNDYYFDYFYRRYINRSIVYSDQPFQTMFSKDVPNVE